MSKTVRAHLEQASGLIPILDHLDILGHCLARLEDPERQGEGRETGSGEGEGWGDRGWNRMPS